MTGEETHKKMSTPTGVRAVGATVGATMSLYPRFIERIDRGERERGATLVEYGLLLVLVLIVAFVSLALFGDTIVAVFETSNDTLENAPNGN